MWGWILRIAHVFVKTTSLTTPVYVFNRLKIRNATARSKFDILRRLPRLKLKT